MSSNALPDEWVDKLFERLAVKYGARWARLWAGVPVNQIKDDWSRTLAGFASIPAALAYGLEHLPLDNPPTSGQFREICRQYRPPVAPALTDDSRADAAIVAQAMQAIQASPPVDAPTDWAVRLLERVIAGDHRIAMVSEQFALEAIKNLHARDRIPANYLAMKRPAFDRVFVSESQ